MPFVGIPATYVHYATGPTLVSFGASATTDALGYAEDRVQIDERPVWEDIKNDAFGGGAGVPSDVQYLGSIAYVSCVLNRFVEANIRRLSQLEITGGSGTTGNLPPIGRFMRQDIMYESLFLTSNAYTLTFTRAFLRQGRRYNMGTRHQQIQLMFECHIDDPCDTVLFTSATGTFPCSS